MMQLANAAIDDHWYKDGGSVLAALGVNPGGNVNSIATNGMTAAGMLAQQAAMGDIVGNTNGKDLSAAQLQALRNLQGSTYDLTGRADPTKSALQGLGVTKVPGNFASMTDDQLRQLVGWGNGQNSDKSTGH
jgi:hypothetical protein